MDMINRIRRGEAAPPSGITTLDLDRTHHWITSVEPGRVQLVWPCDDAYLNLEGAVICSWIVALADQALFFATNTLCGEGEGTRTVDLHLRAVHNITAGDVLIDAQVRERAGDSLICSCDFTLESRALAAQVTGVVEIIR